MIDTRLLQAYRDFPTKKDISSVHIDRVGVFIHIYYTELTREIFSYIQNIPCKYDLYISTNTEAKAKKITKIAEEQNITLQGILVLPNKGWDIAPFLLGFGEIFCEYDVCLRLHAKKSTHMNGGAFWRKWLYCALCGSQDRVRSILACFEYSEDLGILCPAHWPGLSECVSIGDNYPWMERIFSQWNKNLDPKQEIDFPAGSMFWFRGKALRPLLDLGFSWDDFGATEVVVRDMTLAHAVERSFLYSCSMADMTWTRTPEPEAQCMMNQQGMVSVVRQKIERFVMLIQFFFRDVRSGGIVYALGKFFLYCAHKCFKFAGQSQDGLTVEDSELEKKISLYEQDAGPINKEPLVKAIAYYLPQFHPFPENDQWWGEGFTEWTNVTRALPLFDEHPQPARPGAMGFYDLRLPETMTKQIRLAKEHGIYGFCFHHYWFSGKRLMERPVDQLLADKNMDMPFCLNWANENWTRRWDGQEADVLIAQNHSAEDDVAFMQDVLRYMQDERYIHINGRPVFLVYRPALFPDSVKTVERWKETCLHAGVAEPYLIMCQTFGVFDPKPFGFDAAVQFPPHNGGPEGGFLQASSASIHKDFQGILYDYTSMSEQMLQSGKTQYPTYHCVAPSWDNTARRGVNAHVFVESSPEKYAAWLRQSCEFAYKKFSPGERFVFLNAWNEWAEGAYLEPDLRYGYAYLNATARVMEQVGR